MSAQIYKWLQLTLNPTFANVQQPSTPPLTESEIKSLLLPTSRLPRKDNSKLPSSTEKKE